MQEYIKTFAIFKTYSFSMSTLVTWTRLNVMLYVLCLSCLLTLSSN